MVIFKNWVLIVMVFIVKLILVIGMIFFVLHLRYNGNKVLLFFMINNNK